MNQAYGDRPLNVEHNVWKRVMPGLEKEGQAQRDEDLDDGIEDDDDEEVENEYELEKGAAEVEYVSDIEGESDDDLEDFEDWVGGQSPDDGSDEEDDDSESASGSNDRTRSPMPSPPVGGPSVALRAAFRHQKFDTSNGAALAIASPKKARRDGTDRGLVTDRRGRRR